MRDAACSHSRQFPEFFRACNTLAIFWHQTRKLVTLICFVSPTRTKPHPSHPMTTISLPLSSVQLDSPIAAAVSEGLLSRPKWLPSWLFYDAAGSRLFDQITELPEYYVTRTERAILAARAGEIVERAAGERALRIVELGAGSCDKTRLLLRAAVDRQDTVVYEPVDVSASALEEAQERLE